MNTEHLYYPATQVLVLAESTRDLLQLAFGPRGALADIEWIKLDLGDQGMDQSGRLYALKGKITITFTLPAVPISPASDDDSVVVKPDIPF